MSDLRAVAPRTVLAVLFTGAFVMGCAEMLVVGMLDLISEGLAVSESAAGALVTANALGLAAGGPLLTLATARLDRRPVLLGATAAFAVLNLVPVLADDLVLLLGARVLIGAVQGLFIAAAITTATSIVPPDRAGRAMATVISGFATASALGLPLGTLLGQAIGWRGSFAAVVVISAAVLVAATAVLPRVPGAGEGRAAGLARDALAPRVLAVLGLCCLVFTAVQSALTYLVPFLDEVAGVSGAAVSAFLLAYGVATTLGSAAGGRYADADAARTLVVGTIGVGASLLVLYVAGAHAVVAWLAVLGLGLFAMGMAPSMQHRVATLAGPGASLAASLPASAVNVGIAAGSLLGGVALDAGGARAAVLTGVVVSVGAVAVAAGTRALSPAADAAEASTLLS